jgi:hypothetical protein
MQSRYLKAVLRQDVGYFDLHLTSSSEVITGVSNDSFVIQDVLSENAVWNLQLFLNIFFFHSISLIEDVKFDSTGAKLFEELCHICWVLYSGVFNVMETNNCSIAMYTAVGNSWCNILRDSDEIVKKDETRV